MSKPNVVLVDNHGPRDPQGYPSLDLDRVVTAMGGSFEQLYDGLSAYNYLENKLQQLRTTKLPERSTIKLPDFVFVAAGADDLPRPSKLHTVTQELGVYNTRCERYYRLGAYVIGFNAIGERYPNQPYWDVDRLISRKHIARIAWDEFFDRVMGERREAYRKLLESKKVTRR